MQKEIMHAKLNWGIIGLGKIARIFASDLLLSEHSKLLGVASRDISRAQSFVKEFKANKYFGNYRELANDTEIDIVYIATPHVFHYEHTMMCLKAGKHVLCEKAFGMNEQQVREMTEEAQKRNLFLMEAFWTRFIPATQKALELIEQNKIGQVRQIRADFGFVGDTNPEKRIFNKKLGGGSLLDVGIYPVYLSLLLLGVPQKITAVAELTSSGVDSFMAAIFDYQNGEKAVLESSIEVKTPTEAYIFGQDGYIKMHSRFHHCEKISIHLQDGIVETIQLKYTGNGYFHEIAEVEECLFAGKSESSKMPLSVSLHLIQTLDRIRKEIKLKYD
jgi:predicted dehydrogenase